MLTSGLMLFASTVLNDQQTRFFFGPYSLFTRSTDFVRNSFDLSENEEFLSIGSLCSGTRLWMSRSDLTK